MDVDSVDTEPATQSSATTVDDTAFGVVPKRSGDPSETCMPLVASSLWAPGRSPHFSPKLPPPCASSSRALPMWLDSDGEGDDSSKPRTTYRSQVVTATPSVLKYYFIQPGPIKNPPRIPIDVRNPRPCKHLSGGKYMTYIALTETRSLGGISPTLRGRLVRQILFHKSLPALKGGAPRTPQSDALVAQSIPSDGNDCLKSSQWTSAERERLDDALVGYARWEVNFAKKTIKSTRCKGLTVNEDEICSACRNTVDENRQFPLLEKGRSRSYPHQAELSTCPYLHPDAPYIPPIPPSRRSVSQ
ncbi:hypothetical protein GGX14DRAFT_586928 [Mycena pura]|uniref:Uncharacterized protein n=1 Tax=Mycena pura TaxID=153505 RepID=A0AAD6UTF2_9AGAR|nr:hypothetical protein GGX14DRAFT_586928 [Mycena pura]